MRRQITAGSTPRTGAASTLEAFVYVFAVERKEEETPQNSFQQDHACTERLIANRWCVRAR